MRWYVWWIQNQHGVRLIEFSFIVKKKKKHVNDKIWKMLFTCTRLEEQVLITHFPVYIKCYGMVTECDTNPSESALT